MNWIVHKAHLISIKRILHACIREKLLTYKYGEGYLSIILEKKDAIILIAKVQTFSLSRFEMNGDVILVSKSEITKLIDVEQLLQLIYEEVKSDLNIKQWQQVFSEIINSVFNASEAIKHFLIKNKKLANDIELKQATSLMDYISCTNSSHDQLIFFEQWSSFRGHPHHPCYKTKLGFTKLDNLNFSPEFGQTVPLFLLAVKKELMHFEHQEEEMDYHHWFAAHFPKQWRDYQLAFETMNCSENLYYPIFVHPWQAEHKIHELFHEQVEKNEIIFFKDITLKSKATLSFRTLISEENESHPHIKLPLSIQSTSSLRTLSPSSVKKGPRISKILKKILQIENHFNNHLQLSDETCGLHVNHDKLEVAKHLAIVYRKNPADFVSAKQIPVVVSALFEVSPKSQLPLFIEIIHQSVGADLFSAKAYFREYCGIVLSAYLDLFLMYGVALEGHQQNSIAVFENYRLKFMVARDLVSGLLIHVPTLTNKHFSLQSIPNFGTFIDDADQVRNNFLHSVIQYHIGELIFILAKQYQCSENIFWKITKSCIQERFIIMKDKVNKIRYDQEYQAILANDWDVKGLLRMRFKNISNESIYLPLKNPLREL